MTYTSEEREEAKRVARRKYYESNRDKYKERKKLWRAKNIEKVREESRLYQANFRKNFPEKHRENMREYYRANPRRHRNYVLIRKFGITAEEWDAKFEAQKHLCGCCGSADPQHSKGWQTDHCHTTGKLRDIVCGPCNQIITKHLDQYRLVQVFKYLARHRGEPE